MILKYKDIEIDKIKFNEVEKINDISSIINIRYHNKPFFIFDSPKLDIKSYHNLFNYLELIVPENKYLDFFKTINQFDNLCKDFLKEKYIDTDNNYITSIYKRNDNDNNIFKVYLTNKTTLYSSKNKEKITNNVEESLKEAKQIKCVIQLKNIWINAEIQYGLVYELIDCIVIV